MFGAQFETLQDRFFFASAEHPQLQLQSMGNVSENQDITGSSLGIQETKVLKIDSHF